jgi:hypothetical protein
MKLTSKEMADRLNGREYGSEVSKEDARDASESGLVIVFGASDDLVEFRGNWDEEIGAYGGAVIPVHAINGPLADHECDCAYCGFKELKKSGVVIKADWCNEPHISWTFRTTIPHETFLIVEDGEPFCRGLVFAVADLRKGGAK